MRKHNYNNYFDDDVLAASPVKLIELLYDGSLKSIAEARGFVRAGNIAARSRAINRALRLVTELLGCLNHEAGGDLSRRLADLYGYVIRLLIEANTKQTEPPLTQAAGLLSTLAEAWKACNPVVPERVLPKMEYSAPELFIEDYSALAR